MTTKITTEPISRPAVLSVRGLAPFVLILLATLALIAIAVYSKDPTGMTATDGFVAGENSATNGRLILGQRAAIAPHSSLAPDRESVLGSRGGVGPAWHHGPRVSVANPPVAVVGQPIFQVSPQDNPELSIARRYASDGSNR
jgi:hypothetical protein